MLSQVSGSGGPAGASAARLLTSGPMSTMTSFWMSSGRSDGKSIAVRPSGGESGWCRPRRTLMARFGPRIKYPGGGTRGFRRPVRKRPELPRRRRHHRERLRDLLTVLLFVARLDVCPRLQCLTLDGQRGREHDLGPIVEGDHPPARIDGLDLALDVGGP